jgi:staphyloferrin B biosynthesis citrate synthase
LSHPIIRRWDDDDVAMGLRVQLSRSGDIALIAQSSGHDFIWIDTQHSIIDLQTIKDIALVAGACGVAPLVRVRTVDDPDTTLLLDNGLAGVVFPNVETGAEAQRAVDRSKFAPVGKRSLGGTMPQFGHRSIPWSEAIPTLNAGTLVVVMVESVLGLENIEEIAGVDGVDVIHLGMKDMLQSMGRVGQYGHPEIMSALDRVIEVATARGIHAGAGGGRGVEDQIEAMRRGVRMITTQSDLGLVSSGSKKLVEELRSGMRANR